jgi:predicted dehydrogenase
MKTFQISRRSFIKTCTTTAAATGLPLWFMERELAMAAEGAPAPTSPNDRPGIALVGSGSQGSGDASGAARYGDIVAVCDVDTGHLDGAVRRFTKNGKAPKKYTDFRKVMEDKDVQVVIGGTPDHWHSLVNIAAAKAKKDIYSEKPLTLTIDEGKQVVKAVRDNKVVLQTGTQQRSDRRFRLACELVRNERIGKLKQVIVYLPAGLRAGPFQPSPVPAGLDWDFWQGQAPKTDYIKERCHTNFRFWLDYSGGSMTDWGAHHNDIARWAIGLEGPVEVEGKVLAEPIPGGYDAISEYEIVFTWANGVKHIVRTTKDDNIFGSVVNRDGQRNGIRFEGTDGWIWVNRGDMQVSKEELMTTPIPENGVHLEVSGDHMRNFFDCVKSRKDPIAKVEVGHRSACICHFAAIALRLRRKLQWDPEKELFTGDGAKEANAFVAREMRKPYDYSFVG